MAVDGAVGDMDAGIVSRLHQLLAGEDHGRPGHQCVEDGEFESRHLECAAGQVDRSSRTIEHDLTHSEHCGSVGGAIARPCALEDSPDAGDQLARAEGLRHIIVAAHFKTEDAIDLLIARRQEEDRQGGGLADFPADLEAVDVRQTDVEHDEIGAGATKGREGFLARPGNHGPHTGPLNGKADDIADMRLVVDHQYLLHVSVPSPRIPPA